MADALREFIVRRRIELDEMEGPLLKQLKLIGEERERLRRAALAANLEATAPAETGRPRTTRSPRRLPEKTIKEAVLEILGERKGGMIALAILAEINKRFGTDYPRTSLSPQLSRLKGEGSIMLEGNAWRLTTDVPQKTEAADPNLFDEPGSAASDVPEHLK